MLRGKPPEARAGMQTRTDLHLMTDVSSQEAVAGGKRLLRVGGACAVSCRLVLPTCAAAADGTRAHASMR